MPKLLASLLLSTAALFAQAVPFAQDGALKMLYDNRMYPQAVESRGEVYMVWRGDHGLPWIRSYNLAKRTFSPPWMLLNGMDVDIDAKRFDSDQHYSPVIWAEPDGFLHVAFGFHRTPGFHFVSRTPGDVNEWKRLPDISHSISYPKIHRIAGGKTLVYFRESGHLGFWTYRITSDGGLTWTAPDQPLIDMDAPPNDAPMAPHAGSYETTRVSADGKTLHVAFIWKVEDPVLSERYGVVLHDYTRRHNLYYLRLDLESSKAYNLAGKQLPRPINKGVADRDCLVWDTAGRSAAVGPSIALGDRGEPYLMLPVSGKTPYSSAFYFVRPQDSKWIQTRLTETSHPFNSSHLERRHDGSFRAFLIVGEGEAVAEDEMNSYGWGERIEEWVSDPGGEHWRRTRDLTPDPALRYQNIQFVRGQNEERLDALLLFYAWQGQGMGRAYLLDERK